MSLAVYLFSFVFTSIFSFCLGFFVLYKNGKNKVAQKWAISCFCCSAWSLFSALCYSATSYNAALLYGKILNVIAAYMCVFVAHFCSEVSESKKSLFIFKMGYINAGLITLFAFGDHFVDVSPFLKFNFYPHPKILYHFFTAHFFFYFLLGEVYLIKSLSLLGETKKNQIKYILFALTCGYIAGICSFLAAYRVPIEPIGSNFVWLYAAIISFAILKHQLLDIKVVLKKTIFYSSLTFAISLFYILLVFFIHRALTSRTSIGGISYYSLIPSIGSLFFFILGFIFLFNKPKAKQKTIFSILCFETFFWQLVWLCSFLYPPKSLYDSLSKVAYITISFIPATFYHFIVTYSKKRDESKYVYFFYLISFIFVLLIFPTELFIAGDRKFDWGYFVLPGPLHPLFAVFAVTTMLRGLVLLIDFLKREPSSVVQNQTKYLFLATGFYFLCNLDFLQVYGATWFPIGSIFFLISCCIIAYAIPKHNLLDIQIVIRKAVLYTIFMVCLSLVYLPVIFLLYSIFAQHYSRSVSVSNFLGILFIAISFKPIEILCNRFLEKYFFKGTIGEISAQKEKLESELERRERLKSVGILAAGMAHEIKNPLTSIQTFAEYLPAKYDDPEFRNKFSKIVTQEVGRIKDIIQDLLVFSKPKEPRPSVCDLERLIQEITDFMSSDLLKAGIGITFSCEKTTAFIDKDQFKQVLLNILSNAIDALKGQPTRAISIAAWSVDGKAIIDIEDTGCGIPAERLPHIFDPFYSHKEGGTGLGLAITHSIVTKNNGQISVRSSPSLGTVFTLVFPSVNLDNI